MNLCANYSDLYSEYLLAWPKPVHGLMAMPKSTGCFKDPRNLFFLMQTWKCCFLYMKINYKRCCREIIEILILKTPKGNANVCTTLLIHFVWYQTFIPTGYQMPWPTLKYTFVRITILSGRIENKYIQYIPRGFKCFTVYASPFRWNSGIFLV